MVAKAKKAVAKKAAPAKKPIAKKAAPKAAAAPKATNKQVKKEAAKPKKNAPAKDNSGAKELDLCLILDCTSSMWSWIERSKDTLKQIIDVVKGENPGLDIQVCFVGYRDITDRERFTMKEFTDDVEGMKKFISTVRAEGGADFPEDVQGGFNKALNMKWRKGSTKTAFLIADAPGHGKDLCDWGDSYPNGSPEGYKLQDQMREFAKQKIHFTFVKVNEHCNKMIGVMRDNYDPLGMDLNVTDLANACQTKSKEEVTKAFVNAASFILSAAVGGKGKGAKGKALAKVKRTEAPLWDPKKFAVNQFFSQTAYLRVDDIAGNTVTVQNSYGQNLYVSKDILENMYSADHFDKEIPMNMTSLAELLHTVQDHIFTVAFRKQATEDNTISTLQDADQKDFKDPKALSKMVKEIVGGEPCTMICHMVEVQNNLGRSLVIDLSSKSANKFRQVDHRTIEHIIFQNVKYVLKKGAKAPEEVKFDKDAAKWDSKKLAKGNWFSGTNYYQAVSDKGDQISCKSGGMTIDISRDILEYEMHNSDVYAEEQKVTLTELATKLAEANSQCFTVCFTTKVNEKDVQEKLSTVKVKDLKNAAAAKALAKEILVGRESTLIGRLSRSEGKLGRSLVIDLPTQGYRQVDHRTLKWLVINNTKYIIKK